MPTVKSILLALLLSLGLSSTTEASLITVPFTAVVVNSPPFNGTLGTGTFVYDDDFLTEFDYEEVDPTTGLSVEFTLFGQTFTEVNAADYHSGPVLYLLDGEPQGLNFIISESGAGISNPTLITQPGAYSINFADSFETDEGGVLTTTITVGTTPLVTAVPEPSTFALLSIGGLALFGYGVRRRRHKRLEA
jgi:PEP-CTERM motif